jgi:phage baseplate assembly protein gpV
MAQLPYHGEKNIFDRVLGKDTVNNYIAHLYSNARTPAKADTVNQYTEVTGGGYAEIELVAGDWTVSYASGTTKMTATVNFVMTGAVAQIYGYYLTDNTGTILVHAEIFDDAPISSPGGGSTVTVNIEIQLNSPS